MTHSNITQVPLQLTRLKVIQYVDIGYCAGSPSFVHPPSFFHCLPWVVRRLSPPQNTNPFPHGNSSGNVTDSKFDPRSAGKPRIQSISVDSVKLVSLFSGPIVKEVGIGNEPSTLMFWFMRFRNRAEMKNRLEFGAQWWKLDLRSGLCSI